MPGLVGLISELPNDVCQEKLDLMVQVIRQGLSYHYGQYKDSDSQIHVGWTCHEHSFADCMPIFNEKRNIVLFLAGEVFLDADQKQQLRRKGHDFAEDNASYLVHLYEEMESEFFVHLNGLYSGLIIDKRKNRSYLFNDRFGMHRLFIRTERDSFCFSSEAKALLAAFPETREYDPLGLTEYLTCGCTLGNRSLFKNIEVLPGGSLLIFTNGKLHRKCKYFDRMIWEQQVCVSEKAFTPTFNATFPRVARKYCLSQEAVAMSLTGGIDSRMVLGCLELTPGRLPCYTFGSAYRTTFDVMVSRQVAKICGQTHKELILGEGFLSEIPYYLENAVFLSDGYLGLSGAAELYANRLAREIALVRLTGNYGSEVLRGSRAFKWIMPRGGILDFGLGKYAPEAKNNFVQISGMNKTSFAVFQQGPYQGYGRMAIERSQLELRTPYLDNDILKLVYQAPSNIDGALLAETVIANCRPELLTIPTDRGFYGSDGSMIKKLRHANREVLFKAEYLIGHGAPDPIVKFNHIFKCLRLEEALLGRHKFYHLRLWLRERLSGYAREVLLHDKSSDVSTYFGKKTLQGILDDHYKEKKNYTNEIDSLLTVALTRRLLLSENILQGKQRA